MTKEELAKALIVVAEVIGHELSPAASKMMAGELWGLPSAALSVALKRCQREVTGRLTLAAILSRVDDGWPEPETAWALALPARNESATVVWTDEIAAAFGVASELLETGDRVAARLAFLESYRPALATARAQKLEPKWWATLGSDPGSRARALLDAAERRRLPTEYVRGLVGGDLEADRRLRALEGSSAPALPPGEPVPPEQIRQLISDAKLKRIK